MCRSGDTVGACRASSVTESESAKHRHHRRHALLASTVVAASRRKFFLPLFLSFLLSNGAANFAANNHFQFRCVSIALLLSLSRTSTSRIGKKKKGGKKRKLFPKSWARQSGDETRLFFPFSTGSPVRSCVSATNRYRIGHKWRESNSWWCALHARAMLVHCVTGTRRRVFAGNGTGVRSGYIYTHDTAYAVTSVSVARLERSGWNDAFERCDYEACGVGRTRSPRFKVSWSRVSLNRFSKRFPLSSAREREREKPPSLLHRNLLSIVPSRDGNCFQNFKISISLRFLDFRNLSFDDPRRSAGFSQSRLVTSASLMRASADYLPGNGTRSRDEKFGRREEGGI